MEKTQTPIMRAISQQMKGGANWVLISNGLLMVYDPNNYRCALITNNPVRINQFYAQYETKKD